MTGAFEYNPAAVAEQIAMVQQTSGVLDDIENRAKQALAQIRDFWDAQGATAYEDASLIIHQGIQQGRDTLANQAQVTDVSHQDSIGTDAAAAASIAAI